MAPEKPACRNERILPLMFNAVLFDFIGTTVKEADNDVILHCFQQAFREHVPAVDAACLRRQRGKEKRAMIRSVLLHHRYPAALTEVIYCGFKSALQESLHLFSEAEDAAVLFRELKAAGVRIGIGTGLERDIFTLICERIGWRMEWFDYVGISSEIGPGRPHPAMILDMITKLDVSDKKKFLKVGDTVADIEEGKNAGVVTAVVLAGSQDEEMLRAASPDFVLTDLAALRTVVTGQTTQAF